MVARHRALDIRDKRWPFLLPEESIDALAPKRPEPDAVLAECIEATMSQFPGQWQQVMELAADGVNRQEIARRMGRGRRTIQYWLEKMRNKLLHCIEE